MDAMASFRCNVIRCLIAQGLMDYFPVIEVEIIGQTKARLNDVISVYRETMAGGHSTVKEVVKVKVPVLRGSAT